MTSCTCSPCTACCTCSVTTTPNPPRNGRCSGCRTNCSTVGGTPPAGRGDATMDSLDIVLLVLAAALIPLAGLCAAADAAITMVSPARVEELDREGRRAAVALSTWGFHPWVAIVVVIVMLVVCYVVIGVLPRTLGRQHPYPAGLAAAAPP